MKKYIFSDIKFDWQTVFVVLGIIISIVSYHSTKERSDYCNIFDKEGQLVEYKILSKKNNSDYDSRGDMVLVNTKTGEWITKDFSYSDYIIFETADPGDTIRIKGTLKETLTPAEKEKLWSGTEPYECTWLFPLFYGVIMTLFGIFMDENEPKKLLIIAGILFFFTGIIFGIFI